MSGVLDSVGLEVFHAGYVEKVVLPKHWALVDATAKREIEHRIVQEAAGDGNLGTNNPHLLFLPLARSHHRTGKGILDDVGDWRGWKLVEIRATQLRIKRPKR